MQDKNMVKKFLSLIGWKVNSDESLVALAKPPFEEEEEDSEKESEAPEEEDEEEDKKPKAKKNAQAPVFPKEIMEINALVEKIGGVDVFKALLLNAAETMQANQEREEQERETLIAQLVENSAGTITEDDFEEVDLNAVRLMVKVAPGYQLPVDYRALNSNTVKSNKESAAPRPAFFLAEKSE